MSAARLRLRDYGLLMLFVAVAYWPLSTMHHMTRWDSVETYFPFRFFLSDCLRNGILPLWNPYQMGGYPFYGDPQSGAWYPVAWLFCSVSAYNFTLFRLEFLFTVSVAAFGMYELIRSFELGRAVALIAAISYCTCGFFVSNAEHFTWVISAGWLPWVFWSYHQLIKTAHFGYALLLGLFLFLLLSGGYPAFFIIACYLLLVFFVCFLFRRHTREAILKSLTLHFLSAFVFLILSAGILLSWIQAIPLTTRGTGVSAVQMNIYPFSPRSLISLLAPFATLKDEGNYAADVAMRNAYFGLTSLLALPFVWPILRRRRLLAVIALLSLLCLAAAFGSYLPVRAWLSRTLPLMDVFRFPSLFRLFFIIGMLTLGAHGLAVANANPGTYRRKLFWAISALIAVYVFIFCNSIFRYGWQWHWGLLANNFEERQFQSSLQENLQLQAIVQSLLLGMLLIILLLRNGRHFNKSVLILFCSADMLLATSMNAFSTIVSPERAPNIEQRISTAPHNFPVPDCHVPINSWRDDRRNLGELRTNTGIYFKTPQADGYNSFVLNARNIVQYSAVRDSMPANSYIYFACVLSVAPDSVPPANKAEVRVNKDVYDRYSSLNDMPHRGAIEVLDFLPNQLTATVTSYGPALLNLQQNQFPGWRLFIDGKEAPIIATNYSQMGTIVAQGKHILLWKFDPPYIRFAMFATALSLLILIASILIFRRRLFRLA